MWLASPFDSFEILKLFFRVMLFLSRPMGSRAMQCAVHDTKICSWWKEVGEDLWPRVDANLRLKTDLQKIKGSSPPI